MVDKESLNAIKTPYSFTVFKEHGVKMTIFGGYFVISLISMYKHN